MEQQTHDAVIFEAQNLNLQAFKIKNISFQVKKGEFWGLIGPNGSGKTSLMRLCTGVIKADTGRILYKRKDFLSYPFYARTSLLSYMPQQIFLAEPLKTIDYIALGAGLNSVTQQRLQEVLEQFFLKDFENRFLSTLSGGELARVYLARCFVKNPAIVWLDEPISTLDPFYQLEILEFLQKFCERGGACVVVLHDLFMVRRFASHILALKEGNMFAQGECQAIFSEQILEKLFRIHIKEHFSEENMFMTVKKL